MRRTIRSFVLRGGRMSRRQEQGLEYYPAYQLPAEQPWDFEALFERKAPTIVEIGFGMGQSLLEMAKAQPENNYIGIEVHQAGIGALSADLHEHQLTNVRLIDKDAVELMKTHVPDQSLAGIQIFFPDPWPKKKHHKRRIIQSDFVALLCKKLQAGGFLHCATDWEEYAVQMLEVLSAEPALENSQPDAGFSPRPESRPLTKFERRGERLGHGVWDLFFLKR